jgi:hypothetical protein
MSKRKYDHYEVASNVEQEQGFENYREAFRYFQSLRKEPGASATIWGIDEMGEYTCILSY